MKNRTVLKMFGIIAPLVTWFITLLIPGRRSRVLTTECRNKCNIMALVNSLENYMGKDGTTPVQTMVEKCYTLGPFPALWAVEGVGKDLAEWHMERNPKPVGLLTDIPLDPQWHKGYLMLHAGMGMGFAKYHLEHMKKGASDDDVRALVREVVSLCRNNSRAGYYGAAIESLGLVSRFLGSTTFCRKVHAALVADAPDSVGFFWRGIGRAVYFHPINFMPGFIRPSRAIRMCATEAPDAAQQQSMLAGVAWALTVVNMTNPEVMEWVLENHDDYFSGSRGFFNGVVSSVVMRYDTSPDEPNIMKFMEHKPDARNRTLAGLWNSKIRGSLKTAIETVYPALKEHQRLDEVFHFQALPLLAARLRQQEQAGAMTHSQ